LIAVLERVGSASRSAGRSPFGVLRTYAFRARVRFERGYPHVLGYSRRTDVTVGWVAGVARQAPGRYPSAVGQ
jgi:hypothetical protein